MSYFNLKSFPEKIQVLFGVRQSAKARHESDEYIQTFSGDSFLAVLQIVGAIGDGNHELSGRFQATEVVQNVAHSAFT